MKASSLFAATLALAMLSIVPATAAPVHAASAKNGDARGVDQCSYSNFYAYSQTCENRGNFKTYNQCMEVGLKIGWTGKEMSWYCTSLRLP